MSFSASGSISLSVKKWALQFLAHTCSEGQTVRTGWVCETCPGPRWVSPICGPPASVGKVVPDREKPPPVQSSEPLSTPQSTHHHDFFVSWSKRAPS